MDIRKFTLLCWFLGTGAGLLTAQPHSVAREWNEVLLTGIRKDLARPTVHARNLFHVSAAMYDAWAAYDTEAKPWLLGHFQGSFYCPFEGVTSPADLATARKEAISFAAYRLITYRFRNSPGASSTLYKADSLMRAMGYDPVYTSTDYGTGPPAALGNYLARQYIAFGLQDGANEANKFANRFYAPVNPALNPKYFGNFTLEDPNRWQSLDLDLFIDQSGNVIPGNTIPFLSPEWGQVTPFSLTDNDRTTYRRDGQTWYVFHDPGSPPMIEEDGISGGSEAYKWNFGLVATWSSHLDPSDSVLWDISPASIGNVQHLPDNFTEMQAFYDLANGGDAGIGHALNPRTGQPYAPQWVPRGDYTRVLAEFWADGPSSETPPGHWFALLNYVNDHPLTVKKFKGEGPVLSDLEWDVKSYFALGGAMHDAAISAWSVKGWYDYIRPVSAIRYLANFGQSSNPSLPGYDPRGLPGLPETIGVVQPGDTLGDFDDGPLGRVRIKAWRGPDYVLNPDSTDAGVGWILAQYWWPYQRPSFVTPPFAGYVSGHSTYSRAAAEVLTALTGDAYFPGGMGEFHAGKNEFLVFEEGPSKDLVLQWATYRDASDQCSLSRIWGGIHPPADDIPGRKMGIVIGTEAFGLAEKYFSGEVAPVDIASKGLLFPNPIASNQLLSVLVSRAADALEVEVLDLQGRTLYRAQFDEPQSPVFVQVPIRQFAAGVYLVRVSCAEWQEVAKLVVRD